MPTKVTWRAASSWCNTRVGWKVHRLTMMQWLNLTKCGLFFDVPCGPLTSSISVGEQKLVRWCRIRRIWRVINQFKPTVTHSRYCTSSSVWFCFTGQRKRLGFYNVGEQELVSMCIGALSGESIGCNWLQLNSSSIVHSNVGAVFYCNHSTCNVQEHCPSETGLPSSVFHAILKCL